MLLSVIFFCYLAWQIKKTVSKQRRWLIVITGLFYSAITLFDLLYLNTVYQRAFHFSDPGIYYYETLDMSFTDVMHIEGESNIIYWLINWIYNHLYGSPSWISFLLRCNNVLLMLSAYAMLTKQNPRISYVDILMLWNPMTIMVVIRNVRDLYILFFVVIVLIGLGFVKNNRLPKYITVFGILMVFLFRSVLLVPVAIAAWVKYKSRFPKPIHYLFYSVLIICLYYASSDIIMYLGNQIVSAIDFIGEDTSQYLPILQGELPTDLAIVLIQRMAVALVSFLFTPHPMNFISNWVQTMDSTGMSGIYTGFDNLLIFAGSIVNYLLVCPILFACFIHYKHLNKPVLVYTLFFVILYVTMYIGVSDIRNRIHPLFMFLFMFATAIPKIKVRWPHYLLSIGMFFAIFLLSQ